MTKFTVKFDHELHQALLNTTTGKRAGLPEVIRNSFKWVLLENAIYEDGGCFYIREAANEPLIQIVPEYQVNLDIWQRFISTLEMSGI